jgi:hypothetical protein
MSRPALRKALPKAHRMNVAELHRASVVMEQLPRTLVDVLPVEKDDDALRFQGAAPPGHRKSPPVQPEGWTAGSNEETLGAARLSVKATIYRFIYLQTIAQLTGSKRFMT